MRRERELPLDPAAAAELDAIDATLAGEAVDPRHADVAELALLVAADRPVPAAAFAAELDARVGRGFAPPAPVHPSLSASAAYPPRRPRLLRGVLAFGGAGALVAGLLVAVLLVGHGGSTTSSGGSSVTALASSAPARHATAASSASSASSAGSAGSASGRVPPPTLSAKSSAKSSAGSSAAATGTASSPAGSVNPDLAPASSPTPVPNGRKVEQSAQLSLSAAAGRIDDVAQEVYDVVGQQKGYVRNSSVTAGAGGSAEFQLSVPSASLSAAMTALSQLRYASVVSRTDNVQDVNGQYLSDTRALADARALRTSLLKQLANAVTQTQIDSLQAQINDAEASIRSDESTLNGLNHQIDYSDISLNIATAPPAAAPGSHGFTLTRAAHDAGRVLTVAAGVALIVLAALVPVALLAALAWWIGIAVRRRRREQALDNV